MLTHQSRLMKTDGQSHSMRDWGALFNYLFVNPGGMQRVIRLYFMRYFKTRLPSTGYPQRRVAGWLESRTESDGLARAHDTRVTGESSRRPTNAKPRQSAGVLDAQRSVSWFPASRHKSNG